MKVSSDILDHRPRFWIILPLFILTGLLSGCFHNFYKVNKLETMTSESLQQLQGSGKYFILHDGSNVWQMDYLNINNDSLSGRLNVLPANRFNYLYTKTNKPTSYDHRSKALILSEVHIYIDSPVIPLSSIRIPLSSIKKIELYDPDKQATMGSWFIGSLAVVGSVVIVAAIVGSNSEPTYTPSTTNGEGSCPFIFFYDGSNYQFSGEIYSGAISPPLERDDYLDLTGIKSFENSYRILMSNKARETQYTNLAELYIVDHPKNTTVFIDKYGNIFSSSRIQQPLSANGLQGKSLMQLMADKDNLSYQSIPAGLEDKSMDEVVLTFNVPKNCKEGNLILRARNSLFLEYSIGKLMGMFGDKLAGWQESVSEKPAENFKKWINSQGIPLTVYLEKNGSWEFQDQFENPGPMAFREDVLTINLSDIDEPEIKIKLKSGKLFWEIDRIGMDFSGEKINDFRIVKPYMATDQDSTDVLKLLIHDDKNYYIQPEIGDEAELLFQVPDLQPGKSRSVFLHSKGHYRIQGGEYTQRSMAYLKKFMKPASFTNFARENYFELLGSAHN